MTEAQMRQLNEYVKDGHVIRDLPAKPLAALREFRADGKLPMPLNAALAEFEMRGRS